MAWVQLPDGGRRATGIIWAQRNARRIRQELDAALDRYYRGEATERQPLATVGALVEAYKRDVLAYKPDTTRATHKLARAAYLSPGLRCETTALRRHIQRVDATTTLAYRTRLRYLGALKAMFAWAMQEGHVERNPLAGYDPPAREGYRHRARFTPREMARLLLYFRCRPKLRHLYLALRLQSLGGFRIGELAAMRRDDVAIDDRVRFRGKGNRWRQLPLRIPAALVSSAETDPTAAARLRWITTLRTTFAEALERSAGREHLFAGLDTQTLRRHLRQAKRALGMPDDDRRSTHSIRKHAIWYWRHVLRLDKETRANMAGHRQEIQEGHYLDPERPAEELAASLLLS